jgi:hypothetical protein
LGFVLFELMCAPMASACDLQTVVIVDWAAEFREAAIAALLEDSPDSLE